MLLAKTEFLLIFTINWASTREELGETSQVSIRQIRKGLMKNANETLLYVKSGCFQTLFSKQTESYPTMLGTHSVTWNMSRLYKNHSELCRIKPSAFATAQWWPFWTRGKMAFAFADLKTSGVLQQSMTVKVQIMIHLLVPSLLLFFSFFLN